MCLLGFYKERTSPNIILFLIPILFGILETSDEDKESEDEQQYIAQLAQYVPKVYKQFCSLSVQMGKAKIIFTSTIIILTEDWVVNSTKYVFEKFWKKNEQLINR